MATRVMNANASEKSWKRNSRCSFPSRSAQPGSAARRAETSELSSFPGISRPRRSRRTLGTPADEPTPPRTAAREIPCGGYEPRGGFAAEMRPVRLYDYLSSGNGYKCRLLLRQLGLPFHRVELDIMKNETHTPEFLAKNPNG